MKKTVNVNINGRAFIIDENAYVLLESYLQNLRTYFGKEEGVEEIVADFEARIEELLSERLRLGAQVINQEHVEEVISRVGKPGEFAEDGSRSDVSGQSDGSSSDSSKSSEQSSGQSSSQEAKRKLFRNADNKMLGGVFSGLGAYFGLDVTLLRIIGVVLLFVTQLTIVPIYLILWIVVPEARTASEKLQMQGKPITLENIGKTVSEEAEQVIKNNRGVIDGLLHAFVVILKILAVGLGLLIGLPLLFALFIVIVVLFAVLFGVGGGLLGSLPLELGAFLTSFSAEHPLLASITLIIVIGLPLIALIYAIVSCFVKLKPIDSRVNWILLIVWFFSLVLFFCSGFRVDGSHWDWRRNFSMLPFLSRSIDETEAVSEADTVYTEHNHVWYGQLDSF